MFKTMGWILYAAAGLVVSLLALTVTPWFGLAVILSFIFGPKVWKSF